MIDTASLIPAGENLTYLLSADEEYSSNAHRMMQGLLETGFLSCVAYKYNGRIKLMYLADGKKPLSELRNIQDEKTLDIIRSMVDTAQEMLSAGYLNLANVMLSADTIYADTLTGACSFIYLPINNGNVGTGKEAFERRILSLINGLLIQWGASPQLRRVAVEVARDGASLQSVSRLVGQLRTGSGFPSGGKPGGASSPLLHFVGVKTPVPVDIVLSKPEFIIGSNVNGADGTVTFSRAISRIHCKITLNGSETFITDMGSMNGTYVNGKRIAEGRLTPVQIGDRIRLASSEFELRRG